MFDRRAYGNVFSTLAVSSRNCREPDQHDLDQIALPHRHRGGHPRELRGDGLKVKALNRSARPEVHESLMVQKPPCEQARRYDHELFE